MKRKLLVLLCISVMLSMNAIAQERKQIGVGVIAGLPTGITGKYMIDSTSGIDVGLGWKTTGDSEFHIYTDYLYHMYDMIEVTKGQLPFYFGAGLRYLTREDDDDKFGIRIPVGLEYLFEKVPLTAFIEVAPILDLSPDTQFDLEGGVGLRIFF